MFPFYLLLIYSYHFVHHCVVFHFPIPWTLSNQCLLLLISCTDSLIYWISVIEQCCQYSICDGWMDEWVMQLWQIDTVGRETEILGVKPIKLPFFLSCFYLDWPRIGCKVLQEKAAKYAPHSWNDWLCFMLYAVCQPTAEAPLTVMHYLWFPVYKLSVTYKCQVCLLRRRNKEHKIWASHCCAYEDLVVVGYDAMFSA